MNLLRTLCTLGLLAAATAPAIAAGPSTTTGALATPANRLAGLWTGEGYVAACGAPLPSQPTVRTTLIFHAGGTLTEQPRLPPPGANTRSIGLGTWSYDPSTGQHKARFRFDRYVNGIYSGFSVVERELLLSEDGNEASGDVLSINYDASGAVLGEVCGIGVSWRS
jgi:hypothetical protein